jgi:UDP-glucose 4-epimerase
MERRIDAGAVPEIPMDQQARGGSMAVMVTGGAGYIGSHCVWALRESGYEAVALDNMETGHAEAVIDTPLVTESLQNTAAVRRVLREHDVDAVIHFAANSLVGESMTDPEKYYRNNVGGTLSLLSAMRAEDVSTMVFSSSAATYGEQDVMPIEETARQNPTSVYGTTKLMMERILADFQMAYQMKYVALRYFNVAGAHPSGQIGEDHRPETHLIPIILQVLLGQRDYLSLFGTDYPTADGTCVRDYVHVCDLVDAHLLALNHLAGGGDSGAYNLGNGAGFSNLQIISTAEKVTGRKVRVEEAGRRPGDPPTLVASAQLAKKSLGWTPRYDSLEQIVETAWNWHSSHPKGYG